MKLFDVRCLKGQLARNNKKCDNPQRPQVTALIIASCNNFGCHEIRGAFRVCLWILAIFAEHSLAEVDEFDDALIRRDKNILWLQVTMHYVEAVQVCKRM